jgi:very-short-patch-repair endonuclease
VAPETVLALAKAAWEVAERQHGVIARWQLLELGFSAEAIRHRIARGRLHPVHRGVYAVGRRQLTREGRWMAAVLACGAGAVLSHHSAGCLWGLRDRERAHVEVSVPRNRNSRPSGITVHRRHPGALADATTRDRIPVTSPLRTLVDLAARAARPQAEALVNQADKLDLIHPERLRRELEPLKGEPGAPLLREVLDRATFSLTDSELERLFLPIVRRVGLPKPATRPWLNGHRVDFFWPELGLVVETDGLRYHRTATQQARDTVRDNAHRAAGLVPVRFTHAQVRYEPGYVEEILVAVTRRAGRG